MDNELVRFWMNEAVISTTIDETSQSIAQVMDEHDIGSLIVVDSHEKPIGIITESDMIRKIIAEDNVASKVMVIDVMSSRLVTVQIDETMHRAAEIMDEERIKRLPVVDENGILRGILTTTDINRYVARQ